jgi:hypothetical protein
MEKKLTVKEIIEREDPAELRALFSFNVRETDEMIALKFGIWARYFFVKYFYSKEKEKIINDAPFHKQTDIRTIQVYKGELKGGIKTFTHIASRGFAKTTRTKLMTAFFILNDEDHYRRYVKVLSKDLINSKQMVTDVYNMLIHPHIRTIYGYIFEKSDFKKEERMDSFTTKYGVKMVAGTVQMNQRGALQEEARPDFEIFDDFENRDTLRSLTETQAIWQNMEEARTALSSDGGAVYLCNYISERGNVHRLVENKSDRNVVMITPIMENGIPTWEEMYDLIKISQIRQDADDFEGEYLCQPSAGFDVFFDRQMLLNQKNIYPIKTIGEHTKIFYPYNPSHRYGIGADVSGGVGLDSSTAVVIDFDANPMKVVATYKSNTIKPDLFAYELIALGNKYGECIIGPEQNNHGHATIVILKQEYSNIYTVQEKDTKDVLTPQKRKRSVEYGWKTTRASKPRMLMALRRLIENKEIDLSDKDLIQECISYTRDDLMEGEVDPRLVTRHFDLVIALAIAVQMNDHANPSYKKQEEEEEVDYDGDRYGDILERFSVL